MQNGASYDNIHVGSNTISNTDQNPTLYDNNHWNRETGKMNQ